MRSFAFGTIMFGLGALFAMFADQSKFTERLTLINEHVAAYVRMDK